MGLSNSKLGKHVSADDPQEGSLPSTPISTPKSYRKVEELMDPRSPTINIARTPLELELVSEAELGTPLKTFDILEADPRSPTTDFFRTPIIISACENELPAKIKNKNLEKVLRSEICTSPTHKPEVVTPKFLGSSPVRPKPDAYKRKSFVGLLETNIDYTETDLDAVIREKTKENIISVVEVENVDPRSPTTDFTRTPIQIVKKIGEIELNGKDQAVKNEECENNNEVIQRNCEDIVDVTLNQQPSHTNDDKTECVNASEDVLEMRSAPVTPAQLDATKKNVSQLNVSKSAPVTPPFVNLTADVRELDKKLSDLIYEDQDIVVCPRIVQLKDLAERSPLRNRNGFEPERKSAQKLRVSDKPRRSDYAVSKIPVFQKKNRKSRVKCENTPPRRVEKENVVRQCRWDNGDATLYL